MAFLPMYDAEFNLENIYTEKKPARNNVRSQGLFACLTPCELFC